MNKKANRSKNQPDRPKLLPGISKNVFDEWDKWFKIGALIIESNSIVDCIQEMFLDCQAQMA